MDRQGTATTGGSSSDGKSSSGSASTGYGLRRRFSASMMSTDNNNGNSNNNQNSDGHNNKDDQDGGEEVQTKFIIRLLSQIQRNMEGYQSKLDGFTRKINELEQVQHKLISNPPKCNCKCKSSNNSAMMMAQQQQQQSSGTPGLLPTKQIIRIDRRINVLSHQMNLMKDEFMIRINEISSQVEDHQPQQQQQLIPRKKPRFIGSSSSAGAAAGFMNNYENDDEDFGPPVLERGAPVDDEPSGGNNDSNSEFEDDEAQVQPSRLSVANTNNTGLTRYPQTEEDLDQYDQTSADEGGQNVEDDIHDRQMINDDDSVVWSTFTDEVGNTVEFTIIKATGKHKCPYPNCTVECVSRGSLVRHYNNFHAVSTTFKCSLCGSTYTRKDNLLKHLKIKHNYIAEPQSIDSKLKKMLENKNMPMDFANNEFEESNDNDNDDSAMVVEPEIYGDDDYEEPSGYLGDADGENDSMNQQEQQSMEMEDRQVQGMEMQVGSFINQGKVVKYKISQTGKHICPFQNCSSEYLNKKDLLRHFHNPNAHQHLKLEPLTHNCSICGVVYKRRDDLTRHLKHKHQIYRPPVRQKHKPDSDPIPYLYDTNDDSLVQPEVLFNEAGGDLENLLDESMGQFDQEAEGRQAFVGDSGSPDNNCSFIDNAGNTINYQIIDGKHVCPVADCGIEYSSKGSLLRHYCKPHTHSANAPTPSALPFKCTMCEMSYRRPEDLTKHIRKQHIPNQVDFNEFEGQNNQDGGSEQYDDGDDADSGTYFTCKICQNTYAEEEDLTDHIATCHPHHLQTPSTSSTAGAAGSSSGTRTRNTVNVTPGASSSSPNPPLAAGENEKQCPVCLRTFTRKEHVKRHMILHANEKFACTGCDKMYSRQDILRAHQRQVHGKVLDNVFRVKVENS